MTIDMDHLVAMGVVVRVGGADALTFTRRLLGAGVRIGTEEQLARRMAAESARTARGDIPPGGGGERQ
jgi:hypothetical protein